MSNGKDTQDIILPDSLVSQISSFERRLCTMETVIAVFGGFIGMLLTYAILFVSDRIWNTPVWFRAPLTLGAGLALGWFAVRWLHHWWWKRRDTRQLARLVQREYHGLGDRLLGIVELSNDHSRPENMSPALCRAAIRQVSEEAERYNFKNAVGSRRPRIYSIIFLVLLATLFVPLALYPEATWNALLRWSQPFSDIRRYTFVSLHELPDERVVAHGEDFVIACRVDPHASRWTPSYGTCRFENQPRKRAKIIDNKIVFEIPGQTERGVLSLKIGDFTKGITIIPAYRPELERLIADITLPTYLQRPPTTVTIENGVVEFTEGSQARLVGTVTRALRSARMHQKHNQLLTIRGDQFFTPVVPVETMFDCTFSWLDEKDLTPSRPYLLKTSIIKDEAPLVDCRGIAQTVAVLADEVIHLDTRAEDDYGVKELWLNWRSFGSRDRGVTDIHGSHVLTNGAPDAQVVTARYSFSPITAHIPEETLVRLVVHANDYYPGRKPASSLIYHIHVLSKAQHAKLIQQQMEDVQTKLEDLAREEEYLLESNKNTSTLTPKQLTDPSTSRTLNRRADQERDHAQDLNNIAKTGKDLLKEALRNKDIPESTLREWAELMNDMKQLAGNEMQQAAEAMQQASQGKSGQQRKGKLQEAIELQKKILKAMRASEKGMNNSIESMLAQSFVNRLMQTAKREGEIAARLKTLLSETIGVRPQDLPAEMAELIHLLTVRQDDNRQEVKYIQDDLAGFFNRTRTKIYNTIQQEMVDKKAVRSLNELARLVSKNVGALAIEQADHWKQQISEWAEMLRKQLQKDRDNSNQQGEGQQLAKVDMEILIALMRARQREESLRAQTRLLEESRKQNRGYRADSRRLGTTQDELAADIRPLERRARNQKLKLLLEKVGGEMMNASVELRRPKTDTGTIAIETEIIELLSQSIQSACGSAGSCGQMMMQSMGMSSAGGGSSAGGTTDDMNTEGSGNSSGENADDRTVRKGSGLYSSGLPEEFKEALEAYFEAVEQAP